MQDIPVNRFKRALAERRPQIGLWLTLESPVATEIAATAGYDWLLLDMEHTARTRSRRSRQHVLAARGGTAELVVRIPSVDPVLTKNLLDAGVRSIMYPYVDTVEQARLAAAATRYPPAWDPRRRRQHARQRFRALQAIISTRYADEICVIVQIETPQARWPRSGRLAMIPMRSTASSSGRTTCRPTWASSASPGAPEVTDDDRRRV